MRLTFFKNGGDERTFTSKEVNRDEEAAAMVRNIDPSSKFVDCELTDSRGVRCAWGLKTPRGHEMKIITKSERYRDYDSDKE